MEFMWVGLGAFVGANARYYAQKGIYNWLGDTFPYGTLIVNVTGSFIFGIIATYLTARYVDSAYLRLLLMTGVLGGYTTFSGYSFDAVELFEYGKWQLALLYMLGTNGLCVVACFLGIALTRKFIIG